MATSLQRSLFFQQADRKSIHQLLFKTSLQRPLFSVPKVAAVERFNCITFRINQGCLPINRNKIHWRMVQIKHFTELQKKPHFQLSRRANWPWRDKTPHLFQLLIASIKPFTFQSFRQNYFSLSRRFLRRQTASEVVTSRRMQTIESYICLQENTWYF